jgi:imidazoleglycerol-phosphate dehydratase
MRTPNPGSRFGMYERETSETRVYVSVDLDGTGNAQISTGVGFLDHMLTQIARHGVIDLVVSATGDLEVDEHHTVEDVGICLGKAVQQALGDMRGINRYGWAIVPMDESLAMCAIDFSGRPLLAFEAQFQRERVGQMPTELVAEFSARSPATRTRRCTCACCRAATTTTRLRRCSRRSPKSLEMATRFHPRQTGTPSTKGYIEGTEPPSGL